MAEGAKLLTFEATYQYSMWPKKQIPLTAAALPLYRVTTWPHLLLFLSIYTLSSSQCSVCLPYCCVLRCKSDLSLPSLAGDCDGADGGAARCCTVTRHCVSNLFFCFLRSPGSSSLYFYTYCCFKWVSFSGQQC